MFDAEAQIAHDAAVDWDAACEAVQLQNARRARTAALKGLGAGQWGTRAAWQHGLRTHCLVMSTLAGAFAAFFAVIAVLFNLMANEPMGDALPLLSVLSLVCAVSLLGAVSPVLSRDGTFELDVPEPPRYDLRTVLDGEALHAEISRHVAQQPVAVWRVPLDKDTACAAEQFAAISADVLAVERAAIGHYTAALHAHGLHPHQHDATRAGLLEGAHEGLAAEQARYQAQVEQTQAAQLHTQEQHASMTDFRAALHAHHEDLRRDA